MTSVIRQNILNKREKTAAARERLGKRVNEETVSIREWYLRRLCRGVIKKTIWDKKVSSIKKRFSWKGVTIYIGLELGS